ncbi:unknown [Cercopithecine alphaherpesvirus 9]|uniref:Packaging protein UL32 n=1 Tax=Cercopithecine herpesvirus 9 (strain DHV) TaxID=36348 RepID=Q9E1Z0_CHV9D|nr:DNA packaging protein UL32 [Cercopithecine alphaherpesvirus 9]AAG27199.1 unknown [Cercopithecine alphaherpesvirus 9]
MKMELLEHEVFSSTVDGSGWLSDAFSDEYIAYNSTLLHRNDSLFTEIIFASYIISIENVISVDSDTLPDNTTVHSNITDFIQSVGDVLALDRPCLVCRTIDLYKRRFGLTPEWVADYAMLCIKTISSPPCALSLFIAAFEFVYIMDRYYLREHNVTLVGSFARRTLSLLDIQRHFFLHVCFRTDGGLPTIQPVVLNNVLSKVRYSNYSFFVQSVTKAMLFLLLNNETGIQDIGENKVASTIQSELRTPQNLTSVLMNWKDCARMIDCSMPEHRSCGKITCAEHAKNLDFEFEGTLIAELNKNSHVFLWDYADLALLLLGGIATHCDSEHVNRAVETRTRCINTYWKEHRAQLRRDSPGKFNKFFDENANPALSLGPVLLTTLKHSQRKGLTTAECLLCCLLNIGPYWLALRQLKRDVLNYSNNNANLFDCILPVINVWVTEKTLPLQFSLNDGGRFIMFIQTVGPEAIYKHLFCDPFCAMSELQTNPQILFAHPTFTNKEVLDLYKARLAAKNRFEGRVCSGLWTLAYAFKAYQIFPRKATAVATFIRDGGLILKRHSMSLVSLEHTLSRYV